MPWPGCQPLWLASWLCPTSPRMPVLTIVLSPGAAPPYLRGVQGVVRVLQRDLGVPGGVPRHSPLHGFDAGIHGISPCWEVVAVVQGPGGRRQEEPIELPGTPSPSPPAVVAQPGCPPHPIPPLAPHSPRRRSPPSSPAAGRPGRRGAGLGLPAGAGHAPTPGWLQGRGREWAGGAPLGRPTEPQGPPSLLGAAVGP